MAESLKHVGRIKFNGRKCLVAYRTIPNEANSCLVVMTEQLTPEYHDAIINLVEGNAAQTANEFAEALARSRFPDGSVMLASLHNKGLLTKMPTADIEMVPNTQASIILSELNQLIAEQKGVSVQDLALLNDTTTIASVKEPKEPTPEIMDVPEVVSVDEQPLSDEDLAKRYRSDADRLSKEAANLRRMAEELVPTKKKVTVKE